MTNHMRKNLFDHDQNVVVIGYPNTDDYVIPVRTAHLLFVEFEWICIILLSQILYSNGVGLW